MPTTEIEQGLNLFNPSSKHHRSWDKSIEASVRGECDQINRSCENSLGLHNSGKLVKQVRCIDHVRWSNMLILLYSRAVSAANQLCRLSVTHFYYTSDGQHQTCLGQKLLAKRSAKTQTSRNELAH